jgi:hypothetical protein
VPVQVREFLLQPAGGHALEAVDQAGDGDGGREVHQQVDVLGFPVGLGEFAAEVRALVSHDLLHALRCRELNTWCRYLVMKLSGHA